MSIVERANKLIDFIKENNDAETQSTVLPMIAAADAYLTNAGATKDDTNELYNLAVQLLVSHWYDNRSAVVVGTIPKEIAYSLNAIIQQLKYCYVSGVPVVAEEVES